MDLKRIQEVLSEFNESRKYAIEEIIKELKEGATTYKDVYKNLNEAEKQLTFDFESQRKFNGLFHEARILIEKEMNDLPLTNRSR